MRRMFNNAMKTRKSHAGIALGAFLIALTGCQQTQLIFNVAPEATQAEHPRRTVDPAPYQLAGYAPIQYAAAVEADAQKPERANVTPPASDSTSTANADVSSNGSVAQKTTATTYTAPAFAIVPFIAATGQFEGVGAAADTNVARVGNNSLVSGAGGIVGRAGLASGAVSVGGTLSSQPGLNRGLISGLGPVNPTNNLFTPRANPLSGPNGRCAELDRAGFFGGNRPPCASPARR